MAASSKTPAWLAILSGLTLVPILVLVAASTFRVLFASEVRPRIASSSTKSVGASPTPSSSETSPVTPRPEWLDQLTAMTCDGACVGGVLCAMTGNRPCPSRFTCIPGSNEDVIDAMTPLSLRLSGLIAQNAKTDLCNLGLSVCFKPASSQSSSCLSLEDACIHGGRSTSSVSIVATDLATGGILVTVRKGSERGTELASGLVRYGTPIRRVALCSGLKSGGFQGAPQINVKYVTFFIEPRSSD